MQVEGQGTNYPRLRRQFDADDVDAEAHVDSDLQRHFRRVVYSQTGFIGPEFVAYESTITIRIAERVEDVLILTHVEHEFAVAQIVGIIASHEVAVAARIGSEGEVDVDVDRRANSDGQEDRRERRQGDLARHFETPGDVEFRQDQRP